MHACCGGFVVRLVSLNPLSIRGSMRVSIGVRCYIRERGVFVCLAEGIHSS